MLLTTEPTSKSICCRLARKEREALLAAAASRSKAADEETREKLQKAKQVSDALSPLRH